MHAWGEHAHKERPTGGNLELNWLPCCRAAALTVVPLCSPQSESSLLKQEEDPDILVSGQKLQIVQ